MFPHVAHFKWAMQEVQRWHITLALVLVSVVRFISNVLLHVAYTYDKAFYYNIYLLIQGIVIIKTSALAAILLLNMKIALNDPDNDIKTIHSTKKNIGVIVGISVFFDAIDIIWWLCVIINCVIRKTKYKKPESIDTADIEMQTLSIPENNGSILKIPD